MKKHVKGCIIVLGFVLFFALFLSKCDVTSAYAKQLDSKEFTETVNTDTEPETQAVIKLSVKSKSLVKDLQYTLKVYNLSETQKAYFRSSSPKVASVDEDGVISGLSNGTTVISVLIKENNKLVDVLTCDVTVGPPAINVRWIKSEIVMVVGKKVTLKKIVLPFNTAESAKFFSANTDIVSISSTGRITAKEIGVTYVFTTIQSGKFDFCKVTVVDEETYLKMLENAESVSGIVQPDETENPDESDDSLTASDSEETEEKTEEKVDNKTDNKIE